MKDISDLDIGLAKTSEQNDMYPYKFGFTLHLHILTKIGEIIIYCVRVIMKTLFLFKLGQWYFKGKVDN